MTERVRDLSFAERATWGTCPVCLAVDGVPCRDIIVKPLMTIHEIEGDGWAHMQREGAAPQRVRLVPCDE